MDKPKRGRGRPPKAGKAMMVPITIRLTKAMDDEIAAMVQARAYEGGDKSTVIREALAIGLREMGKRKGGQ